MLKHPLFLKITLLLYLVCLIGLISAYFIISAMEIPYAVYLQGPNALVPGKAHAFRGQLINAQNHLTLRRVHDASLTLSSPSSGSHLLGTPSIGPDGKITLQHLLPPDFPQGSYTLNLEVVISPSEPTFHASSPVTVAAPTPQKKDVEVLASESRYPEEVRELRRGVYDDTGAVKLHIIPAHGELPRGLNDEVYLLTTDRSSGQPLACTVTFATHTGLVTPPLPKTLHTNALGLVPIKLSATGTLQWELQASCPTETPEAPPHLGQAKVQWLTVPSQLNLLQIDPLAHGTLRATFASIYRQNIVYADLYDHTGHWLWSGSFGVRDRRGGIKLPVHPTMEGPLRLQVSHEYFDLGQSWDMRTFSTHTDQTSAIKQLLANSESIEGASAWAAWLHTNWERDTSTQTQTHLRRLLSVLLRAQPIKRQDHSVLLDSAAKDRAELARWKTSVRAPLLALIAGAMILGLLGLLLAVFKGVAQGKARQRLYDEVAMELDHEPEARSSQSLFVVQTIVVVGTLMLFACSMIFLLLLL